MGADRGSGKVLAVPLWESEEAMLQSEGAADQRRSDSTRAAGETVAGGVERYEVFLSEP